MFKGKGPQDAGSERVWTAKPSGRRAGKLSEAGWVRECVMVVVCACFLVVVVVCVCVGGGVDGPVIPPTSKRQFTTHHHHLPTKQNNPPPQPTRFFAELDAASGALVLKHANDNNEPAGSFWSTSSKASSQGSGSGSKRVKVKVLKDRAAFGVFDGAVPVWVSDQ